MEISLPLLLWAVFVKTLQILFLLNVRYFVNGNETWDVGTVMTRLNMMAATLFPILAQVSLLFNGRVLCQILLECEEDTYPKERKMISCSVTVFSVEGIMTFLFYCSYAVALSLPILKSWLVYKDFEDAFLSIILFTIVGGTMLIALLFREVLTVAARQLSVESLIDSSFLRGSLTGLDSRLDTLEKMIRKVSYRKLVLLFLRS